MILNEILTEFAYVMRETLDTLKGLISNVKYGPVETNSMFFEMGGTSYIGYFRGRNADLILDTSDPNCEMNRTVAARIFIDGDSERLLTK